MAGELELQRNVAVLNQEVRALRERMRHLWNALQAGVSGGGTASGVRLTILTFPGLLYTGDNPLRVHNRTGSALTITQVFLSVGTAPTGASVIADVHKGGTTIFTNQDNRPAIVSGEESGYTETIDDATWGDGEYLTAHIDQIGSTVAGEDLVVHIVHN